MAENNTNDPGKTLTQKRKAAADRKKTEEWMAGPELSDTQKALVKRTIAKDCNDDEFIIFLYRCRAYWLDPLKGEISVQIRNKDKPDKRQMVVIVQRDGYLTIAHRSGQFGGLQSGTKKDGDEIVGWAKVWNKSAEEPTEVEVYQSEYDPSWGLSPEARKNEAWKFGVWGSKPRTMMQKVAESQALRRAFNISGVYEPAEVDTWNDIPDEVAARDRIKAAEAKRKQLKSGKFTPHSVKPITLEEAEEIEDAAESE